LYVLFTHVPLTVYSRYIGILLSSKDTTILVKK